MYYEERIIFNDDNNVSIVSRIDVRDFRREDQVCSKTVGRIVNFGSRIPK